MVSDQAYAPYGEVYNKLATGAGVPGQMFTGDTQDILSGIFDTPNRELNASQGRWLSPDPAGARWNQYAYSTNPNSRIDPTGLDDCYCNYFFDGDGDSGGGSGDDGGGGGGDLGYDPELIGFSDSPGAYAWDSNCNCYNIGLTISSAQGVSLYEYGTAPYDPPITDLSLLEGGFILGGLGLANAVAGVANEAWTAITANAADDLPTLTPTYVIGNGSELDYLGQPGYNVMNISNWTPEANAAWVQSGTDQGANFLLSDPQTGATMASETRDWTMFNTEMNQVNGSGYTTVGNTMVPPGWHPPLNP